MFDTDKKKRSAQESLAIIGGGMMGIVAAVNLAKSGRFRVTLFEKEEKLGGQLFIAAIPPHKHEMNSIREYLERQVRKTTAKIKPITKRYFLLKPTKIIMASQDENKINAEPKSGWAKTKIINKKAPEPEISRRLNSPALSEAEEKYLAKNKIKINFMNSTG